MDHYLDIRVLPDAELSAELLMGELFMRLHLALAERNTGDIGVSFPDVALTPGARLRLHGSQAALAALEATPWRADFLDYCHSGTIAPVPAVTAWRTVARVQVKSSPERLLRRSVRKGWISDAEAKRRLAIIKPQQTALPWLTLRSQSTGQRFRLFIRHGELRQSPVSGRFSRYGLSSEATVPWFSAR